jgi:M6 family metalloprotease-like protein
MLVLLIEFADYQHNDELNNRAAVDSKIFGQGNENDFPYDSQANFYKRSSYGKLNIQGNVLDWYKTDYNRPLDRDNATDVAQGIIKEAIEHHDALGHDFSQYDNDGDGSIDYVAVIWTGPTGEWASLWWGFNTKFWDDTFVVDGKSMHNYSWQQVSYLVDEGPFSPSTLIHETGHALGLADYYDYDESVGPRGGLGGMDQMSGNHDHNAFSKYMLGWLTPRIINSGQDHVDLLPSSSSEDALLVMKDANSQTMFSEFFMIQHRDQANNDIDLPGEGLIIWHIDATLGYYGGFENDNSYTDTKLIRLVEADGLEEIAKGNGVADKGDFFNTGQSFGPNGRPNSKNNDGLHTGVVIKNIEEKANISFDAEIYPALVDFNMTSITDHQIVRVVDVVGVVIPDNSHVDKVEFFIDDNLTHTFVNAPYQFSLSQSAPSVGEHQFKVKVTNADGHVSVETRDIMFLDDQSRTLVVSIDNINDEELIDMLNEQAMSAVSSHFIVPLSTDDFHLVHLNYGATYGPAAEPGFINLIAKSVGKADVANIKNYLEQGGRLILEGESILNFTSSLRNFLGVEVIEGFVSISSVNGTSVYDNKDINVDQSNKDIPIFTDIFKSTDTINNILSTSGSYYDFYAEQDIDIIGGCALSKTVPGTELKIVISSCLTRNIDRHQKSLVYNNYLQFLEFDERIKSNHSPLVYVGDDQTVIEGSQVNLSATISDEDQDNLTFVWQQTTGNTVILTHSDSLTPSFIAPQVDASTTFTFALSVSDGVDSTTNSVSINVSKRVNTTDPEVSQHKSGSFNVHLLLLFLVSILIKSTSMMLSFRGYLDKIYTSSVNKWP